MTYYWVMGRGWSAVQRAAVGVSISIALFIMARGMDLYAAVFASYVGFLATAILYWLNNRPWSPRMWFTLATSTLLPMIGAIIYVKYLDWPLPQLIAGAVLILLLLLVKPLPRSAVNQVPPMLRRAISWFTRD